MSIAVPCARHGDAGSRRSEAGCMKKIIFPMENQWFPQWRLTCSEARIVQKKVYFIWKTNDFQDGGWFTRRFTRSMSTAMPCALHKDAGSRCSEARCMKSWYFLWKINDFYNGALLARRPELCKSLYFLKKTNDFQDGGWRQLYHAHFIRMLVHVARRLDVWKC